MSVKSKEIRLGRRNQITLPKEFIPKGTGRFQCKKNDDGSIVLIPQISVPANQAYFWTERWQRGEKKASEDIQTGRTKKHQSAHSLIKQLDRKRQK